jgi:murein DD-endopeptidase MepM/ murein hydrolase activator NlpD
MNRATIFKSRSILAGVILCLILIPLVWLTVKGFEGEAPSLRWEEPIGIIGTAQTLKGVALDQKSGLKKVWIAILQEGREVVLLEERFPRNLFQGEPVRRHPVYLEIDVRELGLHDGQALLRTAVWDFSYRRWWSGNRAYREHEIVIDTQAPEVEVLTGNHNLNQGGTGLAVYRASEPLAESGVRVKDRFFPGTTISSAESPLFLVFFAIPHDAGPDAEVYVTATDLAGNASRLGFPHHINSKAFKTDPIHISETFLKKKMPEFEKDVGQEEASPSLLGKFLAINRDLREANHKHIQELCRKSDAKLHWSGSFLRLPASARKAGFGDHRTYHYQGREVDSQVHLGIDLASTARAPVPASNSGRVAFAGELGIYGKAVLIDHGFGLFSMYGHLSRIEVDTEQVVSKGEILGYTGSTGWAGGDHLHFSILVHHTFVNPIEWWDPLWIKNNITEKLAGWYQKDAQASLAETDTTDDEKGTIQPQDVDELL